jgi:hypothetical protein
MNTDKLSGELFHDLMRLLDITVLPDREDVACGYLEHGESIDLDPVREAEDSFAVSVTDDDDNITNVCRFTTEAEAIKFIEVVLFLSHVDELAGCNA